METTVVILRNLDEVAELPGPLTPENAIKWAAARAVRQGCVVRITIGPAAAEEEWC